MSLTRLQQAKEILETVMDQPTTDRAATLARLCAGDEALREQLTRALNQVDADTFLATPVIAPDGAASQPAPALTRIGRYELIRLIGEGGMGAVYEAQQENPRRSVALKVLRAGLFSADASRRFQRESQMLGVLHHPCIAQVYEAGTASTPLGDVPYFAMELIRGMPVSAYLKEHHLSARDKLQLLAAICDAVEHAHRHGIVHRDLKPANILIESPDHQDPARSAAGADGADAMRAPRPEILDFGVARAVSGEMRAGMTIQTGAGQIVGTLSYMSPEQVSGDPDRVDERSDVYSLGVLAYEMLSGRLPIDVRGRSLPQVTYSILHDEPTRLRSLDSRLGGDIETIVIKAIEKDPSRRYQSATALAADIRRYLRDEPIVARPATSLYQLRKFARRNRTIVAGVLATFATLLAGSVTTAYWAVRATERRALVEERADQLLRKAYRASIAAAQAALERGKTDAARSHLENAPTELRGWEWRYLDGMLDRSDRTLDLSATGYKFAALDGDWAFLQGTESRDTLTNWVDGRSVECEHTPDLGAVYALSISPRGDRFLVAGADKAYLFDARTGKKVRVFPVESRLETQSFSRDGAVAAIVTVQPQRLQIIDAQTGAELRTYPLKGEWRAYAAISPTEDLVAVEVNNETVGLMELDTGDVRHRFPGVQPRFSADGRILMTYTGLGKNEPRLEVRNCATGEVISSLPLYGEFIPRNGAGVRMATLSPDGSMVAVLGKEGAATLHDVTTMRAIGILTGLPTRIGGVFNGLSFSRDGRWLAGFAGREVVKMWDLPRSLVTSVEPWFRELPYEASDISPDGAVTVTGDWGQITAWSTATGAPIWCICPSFEFVKAVAFGPDGEAVAVGGDKGTVLVIAASDGKILKSATPRGVKAFGAHWVSSLAWRGSDGLLVGFADGALTHLDAGTLDVKREIRPSDTGARRIALSPTGSVIALILPGTRERVVLLAEPSWKEEMELEVPGAASMAWNPDGTRLAIGRTAGVTVYDLATHRLTQLDGVQSVQQSVTFSPDASRVVGGSVEDGLTLWDASSGDLVIDLPLPHTEESIVTSFADDGSNLVAATTWNPCVRFETKKPSEAEGEAREVARRARYLYERVKAEHRFARETIERLAIELEPDGKVRDEAMRRARVLGDQAAVMNNNAFIRVRQPIDEPTLRIAMRESEAVIERCEDGFGLLTRAIVLFRAKRYDEAISFFERAERDLRATRANWGDGTPELSCFWGMCEAARGRDEEARRRFETFDRVIQDPRYRDGSEVPSQMAEVQQARAAIRARGGVQKQ